MNKFILDRRYKDLVESMGISIEESLRRSELSKDLFDNKVPSMTVEEYIRFMDTLKELAIDSSAPIKVAQIENVETISPPIFAALCSKDVLTCMKRISMYKRLIGPLVFLVTENKDHITLELTFEKERYQLPEISVALELVFLVNCIRKATKKHIITQQIMTTYRLDSEEYTEFFGIKPTVGPKHMLILSKKDALEPFVYQNDMMWDYFEPELKRRLSELEVEDSCGARVRSVLIELLPSAENSIEQVALKLGYSKRTLQRKLKEENTTFQQQLNHTRELLAKHYLKNSDMTNEDIAYLLGYQDSNSFIRAFQMWTGVTISEYRKK